MNNVKFRVTPLCGFDRDERDKYSEEFVTEDGLEYYVKQIMDKIFSKFIYQEGRQLEYIGMRNGYSAVVQVYKFDINGNKIDGRK